MHSATRQTSYIGQAWLVILLSFLYSVGLAGVQATLSGRIAENKRNETYKVIPLLVPGAEKERTVEVLVQGSDGKQVRVYRAATTNGEHCGWVIPAGGQGFADRIEILIGLDVPLTRITGLYVLDQKETPGLGDYITGEAFRNGFRGKPTDQPLVAVKREPEAENEIRAITGATISSESVAGIVNRALAALRDAIRQQNSAPSSGPAES